MRVVSSSLFVALFSFHEENIFGGLNHNVFLLFAFLMQLGLSTSATS